MNYVNTTQFNNKNANNEQESMNTVTKITYSSNDYSSTSSSVKSNNNINNKDKYIKNSKLNNSICAYHSYFYSNQNTILNVFVMSYEEQLQKAITKGNIELCEQLIELNCNLNLQVNRKLPLCIACEYNFYEITKLLLKNGANVNQFDFFDQTPLLYAVNNADLELIELLFEYGAKLNKYDSNGTYPLHLSIFRKNDEICNFLLKNGARINVKDKQGSTPLSLAISSEYFYMVNRLLDEGADVNLCDKNGDTPLIKAIWSTMGSTVNNEEVLKVIKRLVALGANINAKNLTGRTALFTSIYQNSTDIALYLINNNAKCSLDNSISGKFTLLHYASFQGNLTLVKALLDRNCDVNATAEYNETAIYVATTKGYLDIIDLLIKYGANCDIFAGDENDDKSTPLQAAIYYITEYNLFVNIVDKLIEGNADLSIDTPGPLLILCMQYSKYNFAKYLVSVGAPIEQRTIFNQSCFYKAFLTKNLEFMEMLIMAGYNMYNDTWIGDYIETPDIIEYSNYYLNHSENKNEISNRTEDEISAFLDEEEYFNRRYNNKKFGNQSNFVDTDINEMKNKIYDLLKYHYTNPLSLKQLARIHLRKYLLNIDYKIKVKINNVLLPTRLKDYLLFKEFDI